MKILCSCAQAAMVTQSSRCRKGKRVMFTTEEPFSSGDNRAGVPSMNLFAASSPRGIRAATNDAQQERLN